LKDDSHVSAGWTEVKRFPGFRCAAPPGGDGLGGFAAAWPLNLVLGGTPLRQKLVLMPRWPAEAPEPDPVTLCFGGNDWNAGMRGRQLRESYRDPPDRDRRATKGKENVLILTTVKDCLFPGRGGPASS
jgi:hypothetical protein